MLTIEEAQKSVETFMVFANQVVRPWPAYDVPASEAKRCSEVMQWEVDELKKGKR